MDYFHCPKHQSRKGSIVWTRVTLAWKTIHRELSHLVPRGFEEVLSESFWLSEALSIIGLGFSKSCASALHKRGLKYIQDVWSNQHFISFQTILAKFDLYRTELGAWATTTRNLIQQWPCLRNDISTTVVDKEWLGLYLCETNPSLAAVTRVKHVSTFQVDVQGNWPIPDSVDLFLVAPQSQTLLLFSLEALKMLAPMDLQDNSTFGVATSTWHRTCVETISRGQKQRKFQVNFFYGRVDQFSLDPGYFSGLAG